MAFDELKIQGNENNFVGSRFREEVFSKAVKAGKRTYFFDVKATRKDEFYLTITESKKMNDSAGNQVFEKHKIFLYREDFDKFIEGLADVIEYIEDRQPYSELGISDDDLTDYSDIEFEDLSMIKPR